MIFIDIFLQFVNYRIYNDTTIDKLTLRLQIEMNPFIFQLLEIVYSLYLSLYVLNYMLFEHVTADIHL
jgi:hypothetical protein